MSAATAALRPSPGQLAPAAPRTGSDGAGPRERVILHVDMNAFYAGVEQHRHPELRGIPMAVAGDPANRHGIILTKSREAKAYGVVTAEAIWEAKQKCPHLVVVPPDYPLYIKYSKLARQIYYQYTDLVEPFGLDESWLDVTGSLHLFGGSARQLATEVSERVKAELGLTVSVGLSWNKVFAKLGSDSDPGDGLFEVTRANYRQVVWPRPVGDLLYVGPRTRIKLFALGIRTIGQLALADPKLLRRRFGVVGEWLRSFARGEDASPVKVMNPEAMDVGRVVKGVGNGLTAPHDLTSESEVKALTYLLAESVAQRLRDGHWRARTISVGVRDKDLAGYGRQMTLPRPTCATADVAEAAFSLIRANEPMDARHPIRALHVRASGLVSADEPLQEDLFGGVERQLRAERLDAAVDELRRRFGNLCVRRAAELADDAMDELDIKRDNIVHPVGYFGDEAPA